jgi:leucyl-tRNA synthetase
MYSFLIKEISKGYKKTTILDNYKKILITMNPIIPHLSNECLKIIGNNDEITWPTYDEKKIQENSSLIVIQINGKKRGLITTDSSSSETEIIKMVYKDQKIAKYLVNNKIKKQIYIKNKLINIII